MKILVVTPYFYPKSGGLESYVYHLCLNLIKNVGAKVVVVTSNHESKKDKIEEIKDIKIYRLAPLFKLSNTPVNPTWLKRIDELVVKEKPDVINAHTPVPFISDVSAIISRKRKIPFVITYHAGSYKKGKKLIDAVSSVYVNTFEKLTLGIADKIIVLNDFVKDVTLKKYKNKIVTILPGITLDATTQNKKVEGKNKLLFVGNLDKANTYKGLDILINALKKALFQNKDLTLDVVGGGDYLSHYKQMVNKLELNEIVKFHGNQDKTNVGEFYSKASILILPTYSQAESLGLVMLEAMTFGLPIIASNVGGIPYTIINKVTGLLVRPKDSASLTNAILRLTSDSQLYDMISENNLRFSKKYNWDSHIKKLYQEFLSLV